MENWSIVSGSVVGTISTAIWLPFRVSKSLSFCDSAAMSPLDSVPVRSTTRPVSWGTATSAEAGDEGERARMTAARHNSLSSPGSTGRSSIPETPADCGEAAAYWIPRFRGE